MIIITKAEVTVAQTSDIAEWQKGDVILSALIFCFFFITKKEEEKLRSSKGKKFNAI